MRFHALHDCLVSTIGLTFVESSYNVRYAWAPTNRGFCLPTFALVPLRKATLESDVEATVAANLGLDVRGLRAVVARRIGKRCVLICITSRLLGFSRERLDEDGTSLWRGLDPMVASLKVLVSHIGDYTVSKQSSAEHAALKRIRPFVLACCNHATLRSVARALLEQIDAQ